jgi:DNA-binding MarR family transcriptional regulator
MAPAAALAPRGRFGVSVTPGGAGAGVTHFRLTARTQMVLAVVAEHAGVSNRRVADLAGVRDQGQISKLLRRLEGHGLLQNSGGATAGVPNAWRLTPRGEELLSASRPTTQGAGQ